MKWSPVASSTVALLVTLPACHNDPDCTRQPLPAGVRFEVTITEATKSVGCSTPTAAIGDTVTHTTGEPVDVGASEECLSGSVAPPDEVDSLYGVTDTKNCRAKSSGFVCQGSLVACPGQTATLDVSVSLPRLTEPGEAGDGTHRIHIHAPASDGCPAVSCLEDFTIRAKRLD